MSSGRTGWWSKDTGWWRRGRVVKLGRRFGPAGPAVLDWLTAEAKSQGPKRGHDGTFKSDFDAVAYGCFIEPEQAEEIVRECARNGAIDDLDARPDGMFTGRISGWSEDIEKPLATARKAAQRGGETPPETSGDNGGQTGTDASVSPNVPKCPPTEQDITEQEDDDETRAGAPSSHPLLDEVMARLSAVAELVPLGTDDSNLLREIQAAQDAGDDPLELADETVRAIRDYDEKGTLVARSASNVMRSLRVNRSQQRSLRMAAAGDVARDGASRPRGGKPSIHDRLAERDREIAEAERREALEDQQRGEAA